MACPSDAEFTDDDRHSEDCKEDQIHQNERSAAVHARHVGEFPYITQTDRTAGRYQNKAEAASEFFSS